MGGGRVSRILGRIAGSRKPPPKARRAAGGERNGDVDYIGFKYGDPSQAAVKADANKAYGISAGERVHMAIFGSPGYGKSSLLKLLIYQNISRGNGFMVLDPHGSLARDVMSMVPPDRWDDVIYVNPASLYRYGRTIQVNPLEVANEDERYVVVMSFVSALFNLYSESWGPRLETVLRNAANALVESEGNNTLGNISAMITDEHARNEILENVSSPNVKHFWTEIFAKQYSKDAGSSAYNKIDKILSTPTVAAIFDTTKSSISIHDVMHERKMLVVDLSTGASDDIAKFLGSIFLNMLYVDAKKRLDVKGTESEDDNPFYVYVDEAHMFSNSTMSEMLRALRKFGVKMTLATQTSNAYEQEFAQEIPGTCKTIVTSRCDFNTANLLRAVMSVSAEEMQRLPKHLFAMFSDEGGAAANAILRSRPVPFPGSQTWDWKKVAARSAERWGKEVNVEKYIPRAGLGRLMFTPLEACIIHMMHFDRRDWYREEILHRAGIVFPGVLQKHVSAAIDKLTRDRFVTIRYPMADDGDQNEDRKRYVLGQKAESTYLSKAYGGRRAGGEDHMEIVFSIAEANMRKHRYCIPDTGDSSREMPDLLVIEPETVTDKFDNLRFDPHRWNEKGRLAVEVETDPTKHMEHSVRNYSKNVERGYDVWFVCFSAEGREALEEAIRKEYPGFERCRMDVINYSRTARGEDGIPDTYDESFSGVRVKDMLEVVGVTEDEMATRREPSTHVSRESMRVQNELARKRAGGAFVGTTGTDHVGPDVKVRRRGKVIRLPELDYRILDGIRRFNIGVCDWKMIASRVGGPPLSEVKQAVRRLHSYGLVRVVYRITQERVTRTDGTGEHRTTKKVKVLEPVWEGEERDIGETVQPTDLEAMYDPNNTEAARREREEARRNLDVGKVAMDIEEEVMNRLHSHPEDFADPCHACDGDGEQVDSWEAPRWQHAEGDLAAADAVRLAGREMHVHGWDGERGPCRFCDGDLLPSVEVPDDPWEGEDMAGGGQGALATPLEPAGGAASGHMGGVARRGRRRDGPRGGKPRPPGAADDTPDSGALLADPAPPAPGGEGRGDQEAGDPGSAGRREPPAAPGWKAAPAGDAPEPRAGGGRPGPPGAAAGREDPYDVGDEKAPEYGVGDVHGSRGRMVAMDDFDVKNFTIEALSAMFCDDTQKVHHPAILEEIERRAKES